MAITGTINVVYDNSRWSFYFQNKTLACWKQHLVMGQMIIHSLFLTPLRSANTFNRTIWYQCRNHYTLHTTPALTVNWHRFDNISIVIKHGFSSAGRFLLHVIYYQICNFSASDICYWGHILWMYPNRSLRCKSWILITLACCQIYVCSTDSDCYLSKK